MVRAARFCVLAFLLAPAAMAQVGVAGRVLDENGAPVAGARVEFAAAGVARAVISDAQGRFTLELRQSGLHSIRAQKEGFFLLEKASATFSPGPNTITVTLTHLRELVERVDVVYSPPAVDTAQTQDQEQLDSLEILSVPFPASQDVRNALPMFAGVVQDNTGRLHFNGGSSDQASYTLDGFNIADPLDGTLAARVSIDAVRSLELESSRFSADKGRGSAGSLDIVTGMGDDQYRFGATNFVPSVSARRGFVLSKWTPRATFSGPIRRGRAWFHTGFDAFYDVDTILELPKGEDRNRSLSAGDISRLQVNLTSSNILTLSALANYADTDRHGLSFLSPVETTLHHRRGLYVGSVKDQIGLPGPALVEFGFGITRGVIRDSPRGGETFVITPSGRRGNYFADTARHTRREQWTFAATLPPLHAGGAHEFKVGIDVQRTGFDESVARHEYILLREDETKARSVRFAGSGKRGATDLEAAFYTQDRWQLREGLLVEAGLRAERGRIAQETVLAPRVSAAWSPGWARGAKLSAGFGVFLDALNLDVVTRGQEQISLATFYSADGQAEGDPVETVFRRDAQPLRKPKARIYSLSLERMLPGRVHAEVSYMRRTGWDGLIFSGSAGGWPAPAIVHTLSDALRQRYDAFEVSARRTFAGQYEWSGSYTYSRARANAVMDYSLESPVFSAQAGGPLGWDTPHRLLAWGSAPVPAGFGPPWTRFLLRELNVACLIETRSGYPFSAVNGEGFLVGLPNRWRLPAYFNINLHFEKKFRFLRYLWAWRFGMNNLSNHGNPNMVNNNIDSPFFLAYERGQRRAWNVRLRFLGRR